MPLVRCIVVVFALTWIATQAIASDKPNVVFFYIDDLGWADPGFAGSDFHETPNIDALAADAMVFTDAYANGPNCAPSRACLLSGLYAPRHGIFTVGDPRRGNDRFRRLEPIQNKTVLANEFVTWAEVLRENGYTLASMGKWHLGDNPAAQGFDLNVAGREWGSPSGGGYHSPYLYPNLKQDQPGEYLTDRLTEEATQFIADNQAGPFFLYLAHYAVHTPIQAKPELTAKYKSKQPGIHQSNAEYAAMIESVDNSVGQVLATLDELGLSDETVVVFSSDNGGFGGATSNHPLRGAKGMLYEGGIRVPLIIRSPGVTKPGSRCAEPVIGIDLYPTFIEITGSTLPNGLEPDGVSLMPLLRDSSASLDRDAIFWHFPAYLQGSGDPAGGPFRTTPAGAIRKGDWKLIEWFETGRRELYNLNNDIGEASELSESEPDKLAELHSAMQLWRSEVAAPIPTISNPHFDHDAVRHYQRKR